MSASAAPTPARDPNRMILVTGAAGFIGSHVAKALLARGDAVLGVDNVNDYYDVALKEARLAQLKADQAFTFRKLDISDHAAMLALAKEFPGISGIVHLAAQPGVRYSLINPYAYVQANVMGHLTMLETARALPGLRHFVYASSSSVYGSNTKMPFCVGDPVDQPNSLYAATKRADELIGHTYAHLYGIPSTGLRFFTVYGPWGRPDMAPMLFARAISASEPIKVFNRGEMWRDFTYIDDIVDGVLRALDRPASGTPPHKIYNLGNHRSEKLTDFIAAIEQALQKKAVIQLEPMQPGDVQATYADIEASRRELGFSPETPMSVGIPKFVDWYRDFYGA
jgi:UDP-glucuronate 4-epimerase